MTVSTPSSNNATYYTNTQNSHKTNAVLNPNLARTTRTTHLPTHTTTKALIPIQTNAKTFCVRNFLPDKKSATCTATQRILFITDDIDFYAATTLSLQPTQVTTTLAAQQPATKPIS